MQRLFVILLLISSTCSQLWAAELPNVLWITTEDMSPNLGCYGDDNATTPTLDALSARGMRFTNAYSNAPVCAPARTTIISGIYPPSTGSEHMRSEVRLPKGFRMFPQYLRAAGYYCTNNSKEDYNLEKPGQVWDESSRQAHWRNRRDGQPFFAVFNHTITHESQIRNDIDAKFKVHDLAKMRVPPYHPDTPEVRRDWAQYYDRITMMDTEVAKQLQELEDAGLADNTIIFFFSDHGSGMPRSKRWLYGSGLQVPMIVYFPPKWKHLAPKDYSQGGTSDRLVAFIDLAPTILSLAGMQAPDWMQGTAFAGQFQTEEPEFVYGFRGRMDERYDLSRSVRNKRFNYVRNYMPHRDYAQQLAYMFETPTTRTWYKLFKEGKLDEAQSAFWQRKPGEELYDLTSDPDEIHNLAGLPEHAGTLTKMRNAHRNWERQIKDVDFLPEWEMHERAKESSPYEVGHNGSAYDFDAVFATADLASSLDVHSIPKLAQLLGHADNGVRYWAALGLLIHEEAGVQLGYPKLVAALSDKSPAVQIVAAEALGRFGNEEDAAKARDVLLKYASPEADYYLSVAAWNSLDFLDERARPALDAIKSLSPKHANMPARLGEYPRRLKAATLKDLK